MTNTRYSGAIVLATSLALAAAAATGLLIDAPAQANQELIEEPSTTCEGQLTQTAIFDIDAKDKNGFGDPHLALAEVLDIVAPGLRDTYMFGFLEREAADASTEVYTLRDDAETIILVIVLDARDGEYKATLVESCIDVLGTLVQEASEVTP